MDKREILDFFREYIAIRGFNTQSNDKVYERGFLTIKFVAGGKRLIIMDMNPDHKHSHVITCLTPSNTVLADSLFELCELNDK